MSNRPKKACTECRQQKARCDAYIDPEKPCSRCRRINLRCVISDPFQRERKRPRHFSSHETAELQRHQSSPSIIRASSPPITTVTLVRGHSPTEETNPPLGHVDVSESRNSMPRTPMPLKPLFPSTGTMEASTISSYKLEGLDVDSIDVDGLFQTYFHDYAVFMPLLDPAILPQMYYNRCPLLFWAIAVVASRTYSKNPTLLELLLPRVRNLALLSLGQDSSLYNIQGLLLILKWPPPRTHTHGDLNWPLCGAVIHMAMQIGLHVPLSSQEYSKVSLRLSDSESNHRMQTWAYCILVYQEICVGKGTPPALICDISYESEQRRILLESLGASLRFEIKLQEILARFSQAVSSHGLRTLSTDQERSLSVLIHVFRSQLEGIRQESSSALNQLSDSVARLVIASLELYKTPSGIDPESFVDLYSPACEFLECMDRLEKNREIVIAAAPVYYLYGLLLSCQILIRLAKTSFSRYIDVERVRTVFFTGLNLSKRMSVVNNDIFSRHAAAATQLWNSNKAFKRTDGTELLTLRIRSRLAMSAVLDGLAWWREEYGGYQGVYPPWMNEPAKLPATDDSHAGAEPSLPVFPTESQDLPHLSDPLFVELGWALDETLLMPWLSAIDNPPRN